MKKSPRFLLVVLVSVSVLSGGAVAASAGEFTIGAMAMYGWWSPFAANYLQQLDRKKTVQSTFSMKDHSALYGPVLSFRASDSWKLTFTLLMAVHNQFSAASNNMTFGDDGLHLARTTASHIDRYDADFRAYYTLNKYADIFVAANLDASKFFGGYNVLIVTTLLPAFPLKGSLRSFQYDCGPGFGAKIGFELAKDLVLDFRLSLYVTGGTLIRNIQHEKRKENIHLGFKTIEEVVLSYRIEPAHMIISLGGRYQAMTFALLRSSSREYFHNYTALFDQLGGVTASVAYGF
ncbi:MAG TPA: hypothetical protein PK307_03720 [Spirochaetota bacterium]|nr:hypothetical protein [Spirochaetota bacterium]HOD14985.1 hypothetical protein [Spirochaetota bacterium]HPG50925.1 hypothetical protein [Spirochaetota bacterium]HPN11540.1 hypothetical protein [Spirochaetota bacterium]HQL81282.1 hypothetical protein [Spirochaetota bacterium]